MGYWELNGRPVSSREADYGLHPLALWKESEVAKELHLYLGWFEEIPTLWERFIRLFRIMTLATPESPALRG